MICIEHVSKSYGDVRVVDDVSLDIPAGGITSIIGANGAGKSTLLSVVARLLDADSGRVTVDGLDVATTKGPVLARRLSVLRQENAMSVRLTVREPSAAARTPAAGSPRRTGGWSTRRSPGSSSSRSPTGTWTSCPAASGSAPTSRWCCARAPTTCCWTSR